MSRLLLQTILRQIGVFVLIVGQTLQAQEVDSITFNSKTGIQLEFIYIAPGEFIMGRSIGPIEWAGRVLGTAVNELDEAPAHKVKISNGYCIGRYKITVSDYCVFLNSEYAERSNDKLIVLNRASLIEKTQEGIFKPIEGFERCAVNTVPWEGADHFCRWLSEQSQCKFRLPTEAEWEFAARGPKGRHTPWGFDNSGVKDYDARQPIDAFPHNTTPEGVVGLINSVGDWVSDYYAESYPNSDQVDPIGPRDALVKSGTNMGHVLRRCLHTVYERAAVNIGESGPAGFRVVMEIQINGKE